MGSFSSNLGSLFDTVASVVELLNLGNKQVRQTLKSVFPKSVFLSGALHTGNKDCR